MRLTLVSTATDGLNRPLGAMALQAYVAAHPATRGRWEVARVEVSHPTPWWSPRPFSREVVQEVVATAPDVLGLTLLSWDLEAQLALAAAVREAHPGVRVVAGGPTATSAGVALLRDHPVLDALVIGEGEAPLVALLSRWQAGEQAQHLAGVAWRAPNGSVQEAPPLERPLALDELPSLLGSGVYQPRTLVELELARGCTQRCRYCAWSRRRGGWRTASPRRLRSELALARQQPASTALLLDSSLNADEEHLARLVDAAEAELSPRDLRLHGFVDLRALTPANAALLARLPLSGVEVSLNSTNPAALSLAGRVPLDEASFEQRLARLVEVCPVDLHLILGMPGDDLAGFGRTLDFTGRQLDRWGPARMPVVTVFWMMVERGAPFWRQRERLGLRLAPRACPTCSRPRAFPPRTWWPRPGSCASTATPTACGWRDPAPSWRGSCLPSR